MAKIISEKPISLSEVYFILKKIEERDETLDYRAERVKKFIEQWGVLEYDKAVKLKEELKNLGIKDLKDEHIVKIVDLLPEDNDDLRAIFYGEITDQEVFGKILEVVRKYL